MTEVIVWSGWIGGIAVGVYGLMQVVLTGEVLGVSSGYGNICGAVGRQSFYRKGKYDKLSDWRLLFIVGIVIGGALASYTSPGHWVASFSLGPMYDAVFPDALWAKCLVLLVGGVMMGWGARMADGCTSGHAISGIALGNWPSMLAGGLFFVGGIVAVQLLFRLSPLVG